MDNYVSFWLKNWITVIFFIQFNHSAVISSDSRSINYQGNLGHSELFCRSQGNHEHHFFDADGRNSSIMLDLVPAYLELGSSCKRIFIAPESHGFFLRLTKNQGKIPSVRHPTSKTKNIWRSNIGNLAPSCPLSITNPETTITLWRIDPCQLKPSQMSDEPVRLLQGNLRITWEHRGIAPGYQIMITVFKKDSCEKMNKHACLKFGPETLLCISNELICDGIQHCPNGAEYSCDEDPVMCDKLKKKESVYSEQGLWKQITDEILKNILPSERTTTTQTGREEITMNSGLEISSTESRVTLVTSVPKKNITTGGSLATDLSKYGPWGYLMLGILLCGGALLVCGLWECCSRSNKISNTLIVTSENVTATVSERSQNVQATGPPNYDEVDSPPSYSILFPNKEAQSTAASSQSIP